MGRKDLDAIKLCSKKKDTIVIPKCTSSVELLPNGKCQRFTVFFTTQTIKTIDKKKMNKMIEQCENLKMNHPEDAHKIPTRHIFQHGIAK